MMRSFFYRAVLPLAFGWLTAFYASAGWAVSSASAPSDPAARERSQVLVTEGDAAYDDGEIPTAISKYRASYYSLSLGDQASYLGSLPVRKAMRAYAQLVANEVSEPKKRLLQQHQRVLLVEFLDAVAMKDGAAAEVGDDVIAELKGQLRALDEALATAQTNETEKRALASVPNEREPSQIGQEDGDGETSAGKSGAERDWLGLSLLLGGSATVAVGAGLSLGSVAIRARANADTAAAVEAPDANPTEILGNVDREYQRAQNFLVAGSVVGGVGVAIAAGGVIRLALRRRSSRKSAAAMSVVPVLTPTTAGLTFSRRF